jgi:hypothetical protein
MSAEDHSPEVDDLGLLWGAPAIAAELGVEPRNVYWLLKKKLIPATKVGDQWVASRRGLRACFAEALTETVA